MHFSILLAGLLLMAQSAWAESLDSIAAIVNGEPITCYEIQQDSKNMLLQLRQTGASYLPTSAELAKRSLDGRIVKALQLQEARKLELAVGPEELNKAIAGLETKNGLGPGQLEEVLKMQGADYDEFKENLSDQILISKLINVAVRSKLQISEEAISEYYRKFLATPKARREVQLGQIFLALPNEPTPEMLSQVRNTMRNIHQKLINGENFAQLVAIHSQSPDREQQGIMGWFAEGGITQRFAPALELKVNGVTEPIRSPAGFHIFKALNERWVEPEVAGESYDEVHARHILLQIPAYSDDATTSKIRQRAESIAEEMQGESDEAFASRAKEASQGPSAENGGDLGWFRRGMMLPEFEKAAFSMNPGDTSAVVETKFGLHIIRVVSKRHVDPNSLQAHREGIQQVLSNVEMQEQVPRWIASLKADADVETRSCADEAIILPAKTANPAPEATAEPSSPADTELKAALEQWRMAWSKQDTQAYFAAYSEQFNPGKRFANINAWKSYRQATIHGKKYIRITTKSIKITRLEPNRANIEFMQHYEADGFKSRDLKRLEMQKTADGWKIMREMAAAQN